MERPLAVTGGHKKAVSYVRFLGGNRLVSASTDNKLKLWDVEQATASQGRCDSLMTYSGMFFSLTHSIDTVAHVENHCSAGDRLTD